MRERGEEAEMEFAHDAHRKGYERVRGYLNELYGDRVETLGGETAFSLWEGSAIAMSRSDPGGNGPRQSRPRPRW